VRHFPPRGGAISGSGAGIKFKFVSQIDDDQPIAGRASEEPQGESIGRKNGTANPNAAN
jgi:hypothetical protein